MMEREYEYLIGDSMYFVAPLPNGSYTVALSTERNNMLSSYDCQCVGSKKKCQKELAEFYERYKKLTQEIKGG